MKHVNIISRNKSISMKKLKDIRQQKLKYRDRSK